MKTKEELEEPIKDTITRYKEIIFGSDTPVCMACLNELRKQSLTKKCVIKRYDEKTRMEKTSNKYCDGW